MAVTAPPVRPDVRPRFFTWKVCVAASAAVTVWVPATRPSSWISASHCMPLLNWISARSTSVSHCASTSVPTMSWQLSDELDRPVGCPTSSLFGVSAHAFRTTWWFVRPMTRLGAPVTVQMQPIVPKPPPPRRATWTPPRSGRYCDESTRSVPTGMPGGWRMVGIGSSITSVLTPSISGGMRCSGGISESGSLRSTNTVIDGSPVGSPPTTFPPTPTAWTPGSSRSCCSARSLAWTCSRSSTSDQLRLQALEDLAVAHPGDVGQRRERLREVGGQPRVSVAGQRGGDVVEAFAHGAALDLLRNAHVVSREGAHEPLRQLGRAAPVPHDRHAPVPVHERSHLLAVAAVEVGVPGPARRRAPYLLLQPARLARGDRLPDGLIAGRHGGPGDGADVAGGRGGGDRQPHVPRGRKRRATRRALHSGELVDDRADRHAPRDAGVGNTREVDADHPALRVEVRRPGVAA